MDANLYIPDGGELLLNIEVPREQIRIDSNGPAKVTRVYSDHVDGQWGAGEEICVFVEFTSDVDVVGSPSLVLDTGCHASSCHTREVQRLRCQATAGKFSVGFAGQQVHNIPYNANQRVLADFLTRMTQLDQVQVEYSIDEDVACTFFGNNITITFDSVNIDGKDGDIPELTAEKNNLGGDGSTLFHIRFSPMLTPQAWEIQKGNKVPDRIATFVRQVNPRTLKFVYVVRPGDHSARLEYANSDSLSLSLLLGSAKIFNANSARKVTADAKLPPPGCNGDWELGMGSSLSANSFLGIDVSPPKVTSVTSPHGDGTFGIGEVILIHVHFSHPIVVSGSPTLVLETGIVDRIIPFVQVVAATTSEGVSYNVAEFKYIVQSKDTSPDLGYAGVSVLELNGGTIKRRSTTPTTTAILTLPVNGEKGSLSVNKNIVIDTTTPTVKSVSASSPNGTYTAGDTIEIAVTLDAPVVVTGAPELLVTTGKVDLYPGEFVQAARKAAPSGTSKRKTILFPTVNHGLSTATSKGLQFEIDGQILTLDSVTGDEVTMREDYTGTEVDPTVVALGGGGGAGSSIKIYTPGYRPASYAHGSGTSTLVFLYKVQMGDTSLNLGYTSTSALRTNGGSIKRLSTTPVTDADLTLAIPGTETSLGFASSIVINTDAPRIVRADPVTRDGVYRAGDTIAFVLVFDIPVVVLGAASVQMSVTQPGRYAIYTSGSGSNVLDFQFLCEPDDQTTVLDFVDRKALRASFGSIFGEIRRKAMTPMLPAMLELPVGGLSSKGIAIDQACVVIATITTSHEDAIIGAGEMIDVLLKYSANVNVDTTNGTPTLQLTTRNAATYLSGSGTKVLTFRYVVRIDDLAPRFNYDGIYALQLNGGTLTASADGKRVSTVLPVPSASGLVLTNTVSIDTSPPIVQSVATRTHDGVYTVGDELIVSVKLSFPIDIAPVASGAGKPMLNLNAGVEYGVPATFLASEDDTLYFSYKIAVGHSIARLSYFSRGALKCSGGVGLNQDRGQDASFANAAVLGTRIFVAWSERSATTLKAQIRVKSSDASRFPPLWSTEDGGSASISSTINFDATLDATAPVLVTFGSKLYLAWQETSSATNTPSQIRVAVYKALATNGATGVQQWRFVDANPATSSGINRDPTRHAASPHLVVHNAKLYAAWHEVSVTATSAISQIRVAVFSGQDMAPAWTFVDGNHAAKGLNYASTTSGAQNVRLASCASPLAGESVMVLYAAWEEKELATNAQQLRVAVFTGTDVAPKWVFIDGNTAFGLNYNPAMAATAPTLACWGSSLIVGWSEATPTASGGGSTFQRIRVKQFNGNLASPTWKSLDMNLGLNFVATQSAANVRLRVKATGTADTGLFATWDELDPASTKSQIRAAKFTGTFDVPAWVFLDGARPASYLNADRAQNAARAFLVLSPVPAFSLFVFWHETYLTSSGKTHIRGSGLRSEILQWQSLDHACVRRRSSTPMTTANLLLPELNSPGALDFDHRLRIDTSIPVVRNVSLSGDIARVMSTALAVQTVDVFNQASLTQGDFKLVYGSNEYETSCMGWNIAAASANSLESALESIPGLALKVNVVKDTSAFLDGHRYVIAFEFPSMGLRPLRVKPFSDADDGCSAFMCGANATFPCTLSNSVKVNLNADVTYRPGVLDAIVQFSSPVAVVVGAGTPRLTLETGSLDSQAQYTSRGSLFEFDVGTHAASPILRGGFRLSYGDFRTGTGMGTIRTTECIDIPLKDEDGVQELDAKLQTIKELVTIGISSITRSKLRNGYRYRIWMRNSVDLLDLVPADATLCPQFAGRTQTIDISADSQILQGEFRIQFGETTSGCIPWNLRARGGNVGSSTFSSSSSLENLMSSLVPDRIVPLQVAKDPSVYLLGNRYFVDFMLRDDAQKALRVSQDAACAAFTCSDGAGGSMTCTGLTLTVNSDFRAVRAISETLSFRYIVQATDDTNVLTYRDADALSGTILRASMVPSVAASLALSMPPPALKNVLGAEVTIVSEDLIPSVVRVFAATVDYEYTAGDEVVLFVQFSEAVLVRGTPTLELNSNGVATFFTGSGTDILEFRYKVELGESSARLNYATTHSLLMPTSATHIRCTGEGQRELLDANLLLPALASASSLASSSAIVIDTTAATILSVSSLNADTAAGATGYGVGDVLLLTVEFTKDVVVFGSPTMHLNSRGSGVNSPAMATFSYAGYRQLIDVGVHATYPLTSGQFAVKYGSTLSGCIDFHDAGSNAATSMKSRLLAIDAIQRIGIDSVTLRHVQNGHRFVILFESTQVLDLPLALEPVVSDVCAPLLPSSDAPEKLLSKATDTIVTFQYPIAEGDQTLDLDTLGASLVLPSADTLVLRRSRDPSIPADIKLPIAGSANRLSAQKELVVDGSAVVIVDIVSDTVGGTYGVAFPPVASPATVFPGEILFHVVFSRPVEVVGTPTVELTTGSLQLNGIFLENRFANYVDQPQPNQVAFLYRILEGDFSANLAFANANVLADARIYGVSTSSAHLVNTLLPRLTISGTSVLRVDAYSVPTTVKLSSPHSDGTFGAGEAIEIDVTFSKEIVLQTGLNHNQDSFARFPTALLFDGNIYVLWTEWESYHVRTRSYLYLGVFSSTTLEKIPTAASPVQINRLPDTFIEKAAMTVWKQSVYAAWDENGLLYCAKYNGLAATTNAWTLIPNMGANKNLVMAASDPFLLVHNLILVIIWREMAVATTTTGNAGGSQVGQIRVALRNDDDDAPLWIFHDGNQWNAGLNKDPQMDAKEPSGIVFKGTMFVVWAEAQRSDPDVYEIVVARRYIINRDKSTWRYLEALPPATPGYSFISAYRPQFAVRRKGFEDAALLLTWYRDTEAENGTEVVTGQVVDDANWEASATISGSVPYLTDGVRNPEISKTKQLQFATCGDAVYSVWLQESKTTQVLDAKLAVLKPNQDLYSGWTSVVTSRLNHNELFDVLDTQLICSSTSTAAANAEMGIFWTEFDGYSTKLRFRHQKLPKQTIDTSMTSWEEVATTGVPLLKMDTGTTPPGYATVIEHSGLESYVLRFLYVVKQGENMLDIDVFGSNALILNGATIKDSMDQIPNYTLFPRLNDFRALSYNNQINIDTTVPSIVDVTALTPSGEYGVGQQLLLQIVFTAPVVVISPNAASIPVLYLRSDELHFLDATVNPARYIAGSGTTALTFEYITNELDYCERLDYFGSDSLVLLGSAIRRKSTFPVTNALLTLPSPKSPHSLSGNRAIAIKPTQPRVVQVTSATPDGTYRPGDTITLQVVFSLPVLVFGSPIVVLETGRQGAFAKYTSGNSTTTLTFTYAVVVGDHSTTLEVRDDRNGNVKLDYVKSLDLASNRAQILRLSTTVFTNAIVTLPAPGSPGSLSSSKNLVLDSVQPTIVDVRSPSTDGTYDIGETIELLVEFSRNVVVVGTPRVILNVDAATDRTAIYRSGSGTSVLRFTYVPVLGDNTKNTPLDIRDEDSFILRPLLAGREIAERPAQVLCRAQVPTLSADLTLPRPGSPLRVNSVRSLVGNSKQLYVRTDGFRVEDVQSDLESGQVYSPGQRIHLAVLFTGPVVVLGTPRVKLNANALLPTFAVYTGGSGTNQLTFQYVVVSGDSCNALDAASRSALELNGGVITDSEGVYVPLRLGAPYLPGSLSFHPRIEISSTSPTVERVFAVNPNGTYGVGDEIQLIVRFSRRVTFLAVAGPPPPAPTLLLQLTTGVRTATYASGDGSFDLLFKLTIQNGDSTAKLEYTSQNALEGTLFAVATTPTTPANLQLPIPGGPSQLSLSGTSSIAIVSSAPRVLSVHAIDRNGTYGVSDRLRFRIAFSYPVVVSSFTVAPLSSCVLELSLGNSVVRTAVYSGGSTTHVLEFAYTIAAGDRSGRLDYMNEGSLKCALLQKSAVPSLAASNVLPLPGSEGSLSFGSEIRIDPSAPRVTSVSSSLANGIYGAGQMISISVTFSEAVVFAGGFPRLRLAIATKKVAAGVEEKSGAAFAKYTTGAGSATLLFRYITKEGDMALPLAYDGVDALSIVDPEQQQEQQGGGGYIYAVANGSPNFRLASLRLPAPLSTGSLSNNRDIQIDTMEPPRVISVSSAAADGVYTVGDVLQLTVSFSTPVVVTGIPTLKLETGKQFAPGVAAYVSGSSSADLVFQYVVQVGDHADRLDYQRCPETERRPPHKREWNKLVICSSTANALQLDATSSIKRLASTPSTDAVLDLPEVSSWPKLRFHTSRDDFVYVDQLEATTGMLDSEQTIRHPLLNEFTISQQKSSIRMYSNGVPDHESSLVSSDPDELNAIAQRYFIELQRFPEQQSFPFQLSKYDGFVGVFLNGIPFRNASSLSSVIAKKDACGGALDEQSRYFYHELPTCFLTNVGEFPVVPRTRTDPLEPPAPRLASPLVGYAFDGFPIYGFFDEKGEIPDLDECNGRVRFDGQYCYHLALPSSSSQSSRPVFMPCLKGIDTTRQAAVLRVFCSPVDIRAVEGLTLANLSRFDGLVIDENPTTKLTEKVWLNPSGVSVAYTSQSIIVRSNGVPDGAFGPFPNTYNTFSVKPQDYVFALPRQPVAHTTTAALPLDTPIGVMVNGVPFFASASAIYGDNVMASSSAALQLMDKCNGLVDAGGNYRYYASPDCLLKELGGDALNTPSPLIGYAFDGFPLYGPYNEDGVVPTDLDACNGRIGYDGTYRYHVTFKAPFLLGCFRGVVRTSSSAVTGNGQQPEDLYRSLSYNHDLRINTDVPRIVQVYTNKNPGMYVAGETLDIVVQWSVPVSVDVLQGTPTLPVANSTNGAVYAAAASTSLTSVFMYRVTDDVGPFNFEYRSQIALNGATIRRLAATPLLDADVRLANAESVPRFASKHQLVRDVKVTLRGLYHPQASDLKVQLYHETKSALIVGNCCRDTDMFGEPDTSRRINREHFEIYPLNPTSGVGFDYRFQDLPVTAKNLALDGGATALQSSTSGDCFASNAIDGRVDGYVSSQSVARTTSKQNQSAWWELRLLENTDIGTIRVWMAKEEVLPATVQTLHVNSNDGVDPVEGTFTLLFTASNGDQLSTESISYNAVPMMVDEDAKIDTPGIGKRESLQSKLSALSGMPQLFITRSPADAAFSRNGAFTWSITFLDDPKRHGRSPPLSVGINLICQGGTGGVVTLSEPLTGDDVDAWSYVERDDRTENVLVGKLSMFPFWILLFEDTAMMDFESFHDAYEAAIWVHKADAAASTQRLVSVNPPLGTKARYVRIIAEKPYAHLTIAEVQVFHERSHLLSQYEGGTPVATEFYPGSATWSPEDPFEATFGSMTSEGTWTLAIQDSQVKRSNGVDTIHGDGAISDWVLSITNIAGRTSTYYMDIKAHVKTLPRHGKLYIGIEETEADHLDRDRNGILDSSEASAYLSRFLLSYEVFPEHTRKRALLAFLEGYNTFGGIEVLTDPSERQKQLPIACDARCLREIGIDPYFYPGTAGDVGLKLVEIVGDRVVKYVPNADFQGKDTITFSISIGTQESVVLGTVEVYVRECEDSACSIDMKLLHRDDYS